MRVPLRCCFSAAFAVLVLSVACGEANNASGPTNVVGSCTSPLPLSVDPTGHAKMCDEQDFSNSIDQNLLTNMRALHTVSCSGSNSQSIYVYAQTPCALPNPLGYCVMGTGGIIDATRGTRITEFIQFSSDANAAFAGRYCAGAGGRFTAEHP